jgi:hypothetical protein
MNTLEKLIEAEIYKPTDPLRLHLGCGTQYLPGYINIDYPNEMHIGYTPTVDAHGDITKLEFPKNSVDEIRLHHVFEHFHRVTALVLLVQWHEWLKIDGILHIETPDVMKSAEQLVSNIDYAQKIAIIRHLEGDQSASWGVHIGQWWNERFENTLSTLGFHILSMEFTQWERWPHLSNVIVKAIKLQDIDRDTLRNKCCLLLKDSMVSSREERTYNVWVEQLRKELQ